MRNLKDYVGKCVDLEGQPQNLREQFNLMDSCTLPHNFVINFW